MPKLQPPHVGPWFPPPTPWEGSPPPTFLPTWPSSPPPSLLVPSQPPPSLPGKPACSPPQPSKSSTSRYGQRFLVADQLFGNLFHKYKCKDEHLNSVIYYFATTQRDRNWTKVEHSTETHQLQKGEYHSHRNWTNQTKYQTFGR